MYSIYKIHILVGFTFIQKFSTKYVNLQKLIQHQEKTLEKSEPRKKLAQKFLALISF